MKKRSKTTLLWMSKFMLYSMLFQFFLVNVLYATAGHGQSDQSVYEIHIALNKKNYRLEDVLKEIEEKTDFSFTYDDSKVSLNSRVWLENKEASLGEILIDLSKLESIKFKRIGKNIHISRKIEAEPSIMEQAAVAQPQLIVGGEVSSSADGGELPGVNVLVKGSNTGTVTDIEGKYSINVPNANDTLIFSSIGYISREVPVNGRSAVNVALEDDIKSLTEVVVMGYGSQRKADITSAVSVVSMENIGDVPVINPSRLLQGQAAGVLVRQNNGRPGQELEVQVRGLGSLGAGSKPLYVIDGFPVGTSIGQHLNPNDIESMTVLKDAASTAIYGARGSNGVILITTKSAKAGEVNVNFTANYGVSNIPDSRRTKMMNGVEFAQFKKESFMDRIRYFESREPAIEEVPEEFRFPEQTQYSTDWFEELTNSTAAFQNYNVTLSAGKGDIRTLLSVGYLNQEGTVINTNFERFNIRANIEGKVNDFLTIGWNIAGSRTNDLFANTDGRDALIGRALWLDPRFPVYNEDGSYNDYIGGTGGVFGSANIIQEMHEIERNRDANNVLTNGYVELSFLKNFKFRSSVNVNLTGERYKEFRPSTIAGAGFNQPPPREAVLWEDASETINLASDQLLTYSRELGLHRFEALLGYSAQEETWKYLRGSGNEFANDLVPYLGSAIRLDASSAEQSWSLLASFARVNYSFNDKYLVSASFRREGSSRFGANNKWGNFPAVSVGWRLSEESFMPDFSWLTDLKLRASYGVTGNNDIGNYVSLANLVPQNYILGGNIANGQTIASFPNANLGWEQSNQIDIGMDLALFENKMVFTAEYYERITNDMLLPIEVPVISGFQTTFDNIGKVENKGVELALDYRTSVNQFNFRSNFNISFNRNKVLEIFGENDAIWNGGFYGTYNVSQPGRPIGMLTGFKMLGIFNTEGEIDAWPTQDGAIPGTYKYLDTNGDGVITYDQLDMVEIGNPHPDFMWGLTLAGDFKGFDINILFTGAQNYDVYRNIEATTLNMDGVFNILAEGKNRWRSAENPGNGWIATTNTWKWQRESNSRYVYDASHLWMKNVSLGYTLSQSSLLPGARIFFSAENLLLVTNYPGNNPEVNQAGGVNPGRDDETYPVPRVFTLGTNIRF